jgi:hypothetical protein
LASKNPRVNFSPSSLVALIDNAVNATDAGNEDRSRLPRLRQVLPAMSSNPAAYRTAAYRTIPRFCLLIVLLGVGWYFDTSFGTSPFTRPMHSTEVFCHSTTYRDNVIKQIDAPVASVERYRGGSSDLLGRRRLKSEFQFDTQRSTDYSQGPDGFSV